MTLFRDGRRDDGRPFALLFLRASEWTARNPPSRTPVRSQFLFVFYMLAVLSRGFR